MPAKNYPNIWILVDDYMKYWKSNGWKGLGNGTAEFKRKLVWYCIIGKRVAMLRSKFPCRTLIPDNGKNKVFLYAHYMFDEHAQRGKEEN